MSVSELVHGLDSLVVSEDAGLLVVKSKDGHILLTTTHECRGRWFTSVKTVRMVDPSTSKHVLTLTETVRGLKGERRADLHSPPDGHLIGSVVMWKRFFRSSYELRDEKDQRIATFKCDGEKYVFDHKMGTVKQKQKSKSLSFTVTFGPDVDPNNKLLMMGSACIAVALAREAMDSFTDMMTRPS